MPSIMVNTTTRKAAEAISNVAAWWTEIWKEVQKKVNDIFTVRFGETFAI
jgi:hypothetical protein